MRAVVLLCCVLAGCFNPSPQPGAPCATNRDCPDGLACNADNRCEKASSDVDASTVDACPDAACMGNTLVGCGMMTECSNGCGGAAPHCLTLAPSNGLTTGMLVGATADVTIDKLNFDGTDGSIKMMNVEIRPAGTGVKAGIRWEMVNGVSVWTANSFDLAAGNDWSFSGSTPIGFFANTTIQIRNPILLNATTSIGVFGGTSSNASTTSNGTGGCQGRAGRSINATHAEGGGGAGGGANTRGGNGGPSNQGGTFTGLGGQCTLRPSTIPLLAGNGGGASGSAPGGGGGGAIMLVAMESITISSTISVSGGGGSNAGSNGGGGGGSGGAILIEAPAVSITGQLTANGGGGGAPGGGGIGNDGTTASGAVAAGGVYSGTGGPANGGAGGANTTVPTNGTNYNADITDPTTMITTNYNRGGGGGGGYGKIEVRSRTGGVMGLASPAATITNAVLD